MSQTKRSPLVYNPANQTETEIISNFVVRLDEFRDLFDEIKKDKMKNPPQHFIIQAQRGYGKTTLLLRLNLEIKNDKELNKWLIPIMFDEEQYGVNTLARFWEEVINYLVEADSTFAGLAEQVDVLYEKESPEEEIFKLFENALKKEKKKIVILLDNFGEMTQKFEKKENQRLREVLQTCNTIRLVGASSTVLEFYYSYKDPFYNFFKVVTLDELTQDETNTLLRKLSETYGGDDVEEIIKNQQERIESIRRLTGGVPRTIVLLFEIFIDDKDGNSIRDLEKILDQVTPLYKHRLDNLPKQQQTIIDAIAQNWDAVSTKEISKITKMPSKAVSSQLNQLEKSQLIEKVPTSTKNHLYRISERFFNIYYLMRIGRKKNRQRVIWLVRFFELWCGEKELQERAKKHVKAIKEGRLYESYVFYVSQALAETNISIELQHEMIIEARKYLEAKKSEYCKDLKKSHLEIYSEVIDLLKVGKEKIAEDMLIENGFAKKRSYYIIANVFREELTNYIKAAEFYLLSIQEGNVDAMYNLALLYETKLNDSSEAIKYYMMAIKNKHAYAMNNLACLYEVEYKDYDKAEKYYQMAIQLNHSDSMFNLAILYYDVYKDISTAEKYYKMAVERHHSGAMFNLALLYEIDYNDYSQAEKYYKLAVEKGDTDAMYNLGLLYDKTDNDKRNAEKYYSMAAENKHLLAMHNLSHLYFRLKLNKKKALELQATVYEETKESLTSGKYILTLLWSNDIEEATKIFKKDLYNDIYPTNVNSKVKNIFLMFIAKKQYNFVYNLFKENKFDIKDKYKPVYYALLTFMGEEYKDELLKMGSELKETVDEIVAEIKKIAEDYK